jgi:integrase
MASVTKSPKGRWVVRWREPGGRSAAQREKTFRLRVEAQAFANTVEADKNQGRYADPGRGRLTFGEYAASWMAAQPHRASTADTYNRHLRNHILPAFNNRPLSDIRKTEVQGWVKSLMAKGLAPATVKTAYGIFASALRAAVHDDRLGKTPCVGILLPDVPRTTVRFLEPTQVVSLAEAMPPQYAALVYLGAGAGLRQGEAFGVAEDRVRWLERMLRVDQQVTLTGPKPDGTPSTNPMLSLPKTRSSVRDVPLPAIVLDALSVHVGRFATTGQALFSTRSGGLLRRGPFNEGVWKPAVRAVGLPSDTTFHDLRHTYASTMLARAVPISDVSKWLGHASITETVDTYGHLLPDADHRARAAIDAAFGAEFVLTSAGAEG